MKTLVGWTIDGETRGLRRQTTSQADSGTGDNAHVSAPWIGPTSCSSVLRCVRACRRMTSSRFPRRRAGRWSGLRRSALATALIGTSVVVGSGLFVPTIAAAPLCATPPLSGTTSVSGVINTYYPGQTSITAGTANTTTTVGTSRGSVTPIAVGDLVMVMQMQGAQINSTNTNSYGDGVSSATASGYLTNASFVAGLYEYATVRSVAGAVIGLDGSGTNGGLVNSYVNAAESATQGQQRFQVVRVPQYSSATFNAATPPAAVAWDGTSGGVVVVDVASNLDLNGAAIDVTGLGFRGGLQRSRAGTSGLADTDYRTTTAQPANGQKAEGIAGTTKWTTGSADTVGDGYPNGDFGRGAPGNAGGGGTDGDPASNWRTPAAVAAATVAPAASAATRGRRTRRVEATVVSSCPAQRVASSSAAAVARAATTMPSSRRPVATVAAWCSCAQAACREPERSRPTGRREASAGRTAVAAAAPVARSSC